MDARRYDPSDREDCLGVFDSLTPPPPEFVNRPGFEAWLDDNAARNFVLEHDESLVGCGGYSLSPDGSVAVLRWGMVRADCQKMGVGRFLLMYRIREIGKHSEAQTVLVQVPRNAVGFYEKQGFRRNGGDTALEWQEMVKKLAVCV